MIDLDSITHFTITPRVLAGLDSVFSVLVIMRNVENVDVVLNRQPISVRNLVKIGFQEKYLISVAEYYGPETSTITIKQTDEMFQPLINMTLIEGALA